MGFLDTLRGVTGLANNRLVDSRRLLDSAATDDGGSSHPEFPGAVPAADPKVMAAPPQVHHFDRDQWLKKLKRILGQLPASEPQWLDLEREAGALNIGPEALATCYREEFTLLVRAVVSDTVVTPQEHRKLDMARELMGIPDTDAEQILMVVVKEAEAFFGKPVEGA